MSRSGLRSGHLRDREEEESRHEGSEQAGSDGDHDSTRETRDSVTTEDTIRLLRAELRRQQQHARDLQREHAEALIRVCSATQMQIPRMDAAEAATGVTEREKSGGPTKGHLTFELQQPGANNKTPSVDAAARRTRQNAAESAEDEARNASSNHAAPRERCPGTSNFTRDWVLNQPDPEEMVTSWIEEAIRRSRQSETPRSNTVNGEAQVSAMLARQSGAKELPHFNGDPFEWPTFYAQYEQSTAICGLSAAENIIRLQMALKGRAREAVGPLLVDPFNVPEIMRTLKHRFGNSEDIVDSMLERVRRHPRITEDSSTDALTDYAISIRNVVATVQGFDAKYLTSPQLLTEMVGKLPMAARLMWLHSRKGGSTNITIQDLSEWLVDLMEMAPYAGCRSKKTSVRRSGQVNLTSESESVNRKSPEGLCRVCKVAEHPVTECGVYSRKPVNDRWVIVKEMAVCFNCLVKGHRSPQCKAKRCGVSGCRAPHHRTLHGPPRTGDSSSPTNMPSRGASSAVPPTGETVGLTGGQEYRRPVFLKVLPVIINGPLGHVKVHALLDEGSTVTLIEAGVASAVGARGPVRGLRIHGANGMCSSDNQSQLVNVTVRGNGTDHPLRASTVRKLALPPQLVVNNRRDKSRVGRVGASEVRPQLLIGQDHAHLIVTREIEEIRGGGIRSRTALGWATHGVLESQPHAGYATVLTIFEKFENENKNNLEALVRDHFAIDSLGVTAATRINKEDAKATAIMEATTRQLPTGQWETGLLWKNEGSQLPETRQCAVNRLAGIERKMKKDPVYAEAYSAKMADYLAKGYAHSLTPTEESQLERKNYLPHFAVFNANKPGKIRVVFDAASKCRGVSLNDHLLTGPDLLSSLLGNVFRFREGKVALAADVQEMFLRIKIRETDQAAQLFLWKKPGESEPRTYKMSSMVFGMTCSPSSAQYVRNKMADASAAELPDAAHAVKEAFYMDDYLDAMDTTEEAIRMMEQVSEVLRRGHMHLTNWASNDPKVLTHIDPTQRAIEPMRIIGEDTTTERVLGIAWEPASDQFIFKFINLPELAEVERPTKRQMLSTVMRIFDPVGFLACQLIRSKILLQEVWRSKIGWDEEIRPEHSEKWRAWYLLIKNTECSIARQCITRRNSKVTLHVFADASEKAACAVAYFVENNECGPDVNFISAKCKVAPLKALSIPRMELQGALMAARLAATVKKEYRCEIERTQFWTDSTTVLCWIRTDPRSYSAFVANRLGEIDELTEAAEWKWVPTRHNPADIGTRDGEPPDLAADGMWFSGPDFLRRGESTWPREASRPQPSESMLEVKAVTVLTVRRTYTGEALPDIARFSSWTRLVRATAWTRRFITNCRRRKEERFGRDITATERTEAERAWVLQAQADAFHHEIRTLQKGEVLARSSRIYHLTPSIDSFGVVQMGSRLAETAVSDIPPGLRAPVILDGAHPYTRLMVKYYHEKGNHPGTERTVSDLRENFFILRLRPTVRRVKFECQACRNQKKQPCPPLMGQIPDCRLAHNMPAFHHCGVDYFGPMMITIGRRREKRYGALFTCLTTRAVHLELAESLSTDSAILAIRRMAARRGHPRALYSDNGTNFRGAEKEMAAALAELASDQRMQEHLAGSGVEWHFNPPLAPHMGGAWESLVRAVKRALTATLKERAPREEILRTVLAEAEYTVNSRPLTHVSVDPKDDAPITPNHLLLGMAGRNSHLAIYGALDENVCLKRQWRVAQQMADLFWRRWIREYLPTLARRQKWQESAPTIKEGEIAIIVDPALPRNTWPKGIITEAKPAPDGQVRVVRIRTTAGDYTRPATRVITLSKVVTK